MQLGRIAGACTWASRGQLRSQESSVHRSIDFLMGRRNFTLREYAIVRSKRQRRRDDVRSVVPRHDVRCARRWNADRVRAIRKRYPFFLKSQLSSPKSRKEVSVSVFQRSVNSSEGSQRNEHGYTCYLSYFDRLNVSAL